MLHSLPAGIDEIEEALANSQNVRQDRQVWRNHKRGKAGVTGGGCKRNRERRGGEER